MDQIRLCDSAATPAAALSADDDPEMQRRRKLLAARRRILEREVMKYLIGEDEKEKGAVSSNNNNTYEELDDEYEEIVFDPTKAGEDEEVEVVVCGGGGGGMISLSSKRRSNSDSDLHAFDEGREVELCSASKTILRLRVEDDDYAERIVAKAVAGDAPPEQGFYRVYDDLDRIKEWDLIPYVLERKRREKELAELMAKEGDSQPPKVEVMKASPDSGRASVVSSDLSESAADSAAEKGKKAKSDSGSSCSADSGTYNLFSEATATRGRSKSNEFLKTVSLQLSSINEEAARRRVVAAQNSPPPPPPPEKFSAFLPPPPLPPRTRTRPSSRERALKKSEETQPRRKDLSSHLGLISADPADKLSKKVAVSVAMQSLPQQVKAGNSPPGKKDLSKHLGIETETAKPPPASSALLKRLTPPSVPRPSQLLVQLHLSQSNNKEQQETPSCRRELDFNKVTVATKCQSVQTSTPPAAEVKSNVARSSHRSGGGGRSVASKIFKRYQCQQSPGAVRRRASSRSPSPFGIGAASASARAATPTTAGKFKAKEARRSFMASLLLSAGGRSKPTSASADAIDRREREDEVVKVEAREAAMRNYTRNVDQALRDGLPVIPFASSSMDELSTRAKGLLGEQPIAVRQPSAVYLPMDTKAKKQQQQRCGTWSPGSAGSLAAVLATPARLPPPPSSGRQHCQSCTCGAGAAPPSSAASLASMPLGPEMDYVKMETPRLAQKRRKSISGLITTPFVA